MNLTEAAELLGYERSYASKVLHGKRKNAELKSALDKLMGLEKSNFTDIFAHPDIKKILEFVNCRMKGDFYKLKAIDYLIVYNKVYARSYYSAMNKADEIKNDADDDDDEARRDAKINDLKSVFDSARKVTEIEILDILSAPEFGKMLEFAGMKHRNHKLRLRAGWILGIHRDLYKGDYNDLP